MSVMLQSSKPTKRIFSGDIDDLWCTPCHDRTPHIYGWYNGHLLTCLNCHPEAEQIVEKDPRRGS